MGPRCLILGADAGLPVCQGSAPGLNLASARKIVKKGGEGERWRVTHPFRNWHTFLQRFPAYFPPSLHIETLIWRNKMALLSSPEPPSSSLKLALFSFPAKNTTLCFYSRSACVCVQSGSSDKTSVMFTRCVFVEAAVFQQVWMLSGQHEYVCVVMLSGRDDDIV